MMMMMMMMKWAELPDPCCDKMPSWTQPVQLVRLSVAYLLSDVVCRQEEDLGTGEAGDSDFLGQIVELAHALTSTKNW